MISDELYINYIRKLNINKHGQRQAPHKPLLLLGAITRLLRGKRELPFAEAEIILKPLLKNYAPLVLTRHQPELRYWHLRSDGLGEIPEADSFPRQAGGFPRMAALRASFGYLKEVFSAALLADPTLVESIVAELYWTGISPSHCTKIS